MVDGHSIWQFQDDGKESHPKAVRVPPNPRGAVPDRAFYAVPSLRHVEVTTGIRHVGAAAWQACQQLQIVKLSPSVISLDRRGFPRVLCAARGRPARVHPIQSKASTFAIPTELRDIGNRAFCGCEQLQRFTFWEGPLWRPWNPLHFWRLVLGPLMDKIFARVVIRLAASHCS